MSDYPRDEVTQTMQPLTMARPIAKDANPMEEQERLIDELNKTISLLEDTLHNVLRNEEPFDSADKLSEAVPTGSINRILTLQNNRSIINIISRINNLQQRVQI